MSQAPAVPQSRSPSDRCHWTLLPDLKRLNRKCKRTVCRPSQGTRIVPHRGLWFARRFHGGPDRADVQSPPNNRVGSRRAPNGRVPGPPDSASPVGRLRVNTPTRAPRHAHAGVVAAPRTDTSESPPSSANRRFFPEHPCVLLYHTIVLSDNTYCRPPYLTVQVTVIFMRATCYRTPRAKGKNTGAGEKNQARMVIF